jgi:SAM-dependent methyltransferase
MTLTTVDEAALAYDSLAPHYDFLTQHYGHERWLERLEDLARAHGLVGHRVLDVACGTGKSFLPLLGRGYRVTGCDISEEMLVVAREHVDDEVELFQADVRDLPAVGPFDLVTWLNDAVNYLLGDEDLDRAIASIARTMAPGGLLVFDANTLASHQDAFTSAFVAEQDDVFLCWHGQQLDAERPGRPAMATVEIFERDGIDGWSRRRSEHRQRWWGEPDVRRACEGAGLTLAAVRGQHQGARLDLEADEDVHNKIVYLARKPSSTVPGVRGGVA